MGIDIKKGFWIFLFGMAAGGLLGISIKYPVTDVAIAGAVELCTQNFGLDKFKVGLSGKIYHVKCKNGKEFDLD